MKNLRILALFPVAVLSLGAQGTAPQKLPDRPAVAITNYKGNWLPVVGADGYSPIIVADGSQVSLSINTGMRLIVGDHFGPGFVTVADVDIEEVKATDAATEASMPNELKSTTVSYSANLTADMDIPDAYAVMIANLPEKTPDAPPVLAIFVQKIGDLAAGTRDHFTVKLSKLGQEDNPDWNILVFAAGREVRSTNMGAILPDYFDRIEQMGLKKRIAERLAKGVDAPIAVFRQMPAGFPDAIKAKYKGTTIKAEVRISAEGRVLFARPEGISDPDLIDALNKAFAPWLFLPAVKDGALAPGSAIIPLKM
jgi:hypothetical protein